MPHGIPYRCSVQHMGIISNLRNALVNVHSQMASGPSRKFVWGCVKEEEALH